MEQISDKRTPTVSSSGESRISGIIAAKTPSSKSSMDATMDNTDNGRQFMNNSSQFGGEHKCSQQLPSSSQHHHHHHNQQQLQIGLHRHPTALARGKPANERKLYGCLSMGATRPPWRSVASVSLPLLLIINFGTQLAQAQCPWARDSIDLHSDCICDFNPQSIGHNQQQQLQLQLQATTTLATTTNSSSSEQQQQAALAAGRQQQQMVGTVVVARRMSVQCAPVDFEQLLRALKQTASIELPLALAKRTFAPLEVPGQLNGSITLTITNDQSSSSANANDEEQLEDDKARFMSQTKLDLLHVGNSSIGALENDTFIMDTRQKIEGIPSGRLVVAIQALHLSRCAITRIEPGAFNGLEWSLTSLSLNDNRLEEVPRAALERLVNLRLLDLSNNRIKHIKSGTFLRLTKLHTLRLADNKQIGAGSLEEQVTAADNSRAPPTGVELGAFDGLEAHLNDLSLKNTQLAEFPVAISGLRSLAFLNLAQNQIAHVPARMFARMNSLTAINLERNRITQIEDDTFRGVEGTLSSLSLLGNLIESFPVRQLQNLAALRRLDLGFNRIGSLPLDSFAANKRLMLIALDGNPLETLPELAFKPLEGTLRGLSVGGKSLVCDCRLSWMLRWQIEHGLQISSRERAPQFCAKPAYLRSLVSFAALQPEHLTCSAQQQFGGGSNTQSPNVQAPFMSTHAASQTGTSSSSDAYHLIPYTTSLVSQSSNINGWTATGNQVLPDSSTIGNSNQELGAYSTLAAEAQPTISITRIMPTTTAAAAKTTTTTTTTVAPTTTKTMAVSSTLSAANNAITTSPGVTIEYIVNTPTVVSPANISSSTTTSASQNATTTTATAQKLPHSSVGFETTIDHGSTIAFNTDDELVEEGTDAGELASEASTTIATNIINQLGGLPDDELFAVAPTHEPNRRKSNRHGYLASNDLLRFNKTTTTMSTGSSTNSHGPLNEQQQPVITLLPPHSNPNLDYARPHIGSTSTTYRPIVSGSFGDRQQTSPMVNPVPPPTSLPARSNDPNQARPVRVQVGLPPPVAGQRIPAIPTTINVYKTPPASQQRTNSAAALGLSAEAPITRRPQQQQLKYEPPIISKGARSVEEATTTTVASIQQPVIPIRRRPTTTTTTTTSSTTTTVAPAVVVADTEFDLERFAQQAASSIRAHFSTLVPPTNRPTTSLQPIVTLPKRTTTTTTTTTSTTTTTTPAPTASTTTTTSTTSTSTITTAKPAAVGSAVTALESQVPQYNTRMSVSSMYRLATSASPKPLSWPATTITTTRQSPTLPASTSIAAAPAASSSTSTSTTSATTSATISTTTTTTMAPTATSGSTSTTPSTVALVREPTRIRQPTSVEQSDKTTRMAATVRIVESAPEIRLSPPTMINTIHATTQTANSNGASVQTRLIRPAASSTSKPLAYDETTQQAASRSPSTNNLIHNHQHQTSQEPNGPGDDSETQESVMPTSSSYGEGKLLRPTRPSSSSSSSSIATTIAMDKQANDTDQSATRVQSRILRKEDTTIKPLTQTTQMNQRTTSPSLSDQLLDTSARSFARRFPKLLADFDQVALVLAGIMCVSIFLITLIITICTCCSLRQQKSPLEDKSQPSSSLHESHHHHHQQQQHPTSQHNHNHHHHQQQSGSLHQSSSWITRLLCCFYCSTSKQIGSQMFTGSSGPITPVHALMMQDDDNSTSSSSGGGSSSHLVNGLHGQGGKSMLLLSTGASNGGAGGQHHHHRNHHQRSQKNHKSLRNQQLCQLSSLTKQQQHKSSPMGHLINHEASMRVHNEAHALDKEYFLRFSSSSAKSRGGRRFGRWTSEIELDNPAIGRGQDLGVGWLSDSCDSDKSCSPGANKNNRYNISDAHRAYLAGKQIQASMFVTTSAGAYHNKPALVASNTLTTTTSGSGTNNAGLGNRLHSAVRCMGLLKTIETGCRLPSDARGNSYPAHSASDHSTDDSRAPLDNSAGPRQQCDILLGDCSPQPPAGRDAKLNRSISMLSRCLPVVGRATGSSRAVFGQQPTLSRRQQQQQQQQQQQHHHQLSSIASDHQADFGAAVGDLVPISAEEEWPEPYMEPLGSEEPPPMQPVAYMDQHQTAHKPVEFNSYDNHQCEDRQFEHYIQEPQIISEVPANVRSYDDAYLANWRTMSRDSRGQRSQRGGGGGVSWLRWTSANS